MNFKLLARAILLSAPLVFGGCATRALWTRTNLDAWNEPADDVRLRLFDAPRRHDVLVVYDEYSERRDSVHTRAYWLEGNRKRIEQRRQPVFVGVHSFHGLTPIPVFTNAPAEPTMRALLSSNPPSFVINFGDWRNGAYPLPVYDDGVGKATRIALTPVTVIADATIVGGYIAYGCLVGMAQSGMTYSH